MIDAAGIRRSILVLAADAHWRDAPWTTRIAAVIFGAHRVVDHLGCLNRITVWKGVPYLWCIDEKRGLIASAPTTPPPPKPKR
ncbi:MAG: hypothetical protein JJU24_08440 [Natronohydrobacter sp.]|nr:hypothetical protein [Natronohydrobacter sp.]